MLHFFPVASFEPLSFDRKPEMSSLEVLSMLRLNLTSGEWSQVEALRRPFDLRNIRAFLLEEPLDPRGNWSDKDLEEALLTGQGLPDFIADFLERYESTRDRLRHFASLYASLYRGEPPGFVRRYYEMERQMRLTLTALRAKREGRDLARELQYEDPTDPLVASILAQRDAPDYVPEDPEVARLFADFSDDPTALMRAFLELRFRRIEEMEENRPFSMTEVLGYVARLFLIEAWHEVQAATGGDRLLGESTV